MTHEATIARQNACHCEAKKHALRQTQDGIVVSFVLHPSDVPASLQLASLGTRYMLALVEIGDDEKAKEVKQSPAPVPQPLQVHPVRDNRLTKRIVMTCKDPKFWAFLRKRGITVLGENDASAYVKDYCGVSSRSEIRPGTVSAYEWDGLDGEFKAWDQAPSCGIET